MRPDGHRTRVAGARTAVHPAGAFPASGPAAPVAPAAFGSASRTGHGNVVACHAIAVPWDGNAVASREAVLPCHAIEVACDGNAVPLRAIVLPCHGSVVAWH